MTESTAITTAETGDNLPIQQAETSATAVAKREQANVEARFTVALKFPRSIEQFRGALLASCRRPRFAEVVQYSVPRGGKKITGLSIKFAEEAWRLFGNLDVAQIVVFDDQERRIIRVTATDLETNSTMSSDVIVEKTVERRFVNKGDEVLSSRVNTTGQTVYLKKSTDDEMVVKMNANLSKARRNLILSIIPSDIREEAEEMATKTVREKITEDPDGEKKRIMDAFWEKGVMPDQIAEAIGKDLAMLTPAEIGVLRKMYEALRDGEATWAEIVEDEGVQRTREANTGTNGKPEPEKPKGKKKGTAGLRDAVKKKATTSQPELVTEQPPVEDGLGTVVPETEDDKMRRQDLEMEKEENK